MLGSLVLTNLRTNNQAPIIHGVNSAVIGISQTLTFEQLISHFLVLSDDHDVLTASDLIVLDGSTCDLSAVAVGSCVFLFQLIDKEGLYSAVFPFELTWIDDTKPVMNGPSKIWTHPDLVLTDEWIQSLFDYNRDTLDWEVVARDNELSYMVVAVSDVLGNHYYHRLSFIWDDQLPRALSYQIDDDFIISVHSSYIITEETLNYLIDLWELTINSNNSSWVEYLKTPSVEQSYHIVTDDNQIIILQVQSQYGYSPVPTFWERVWQFLVQSYEWFIQQCQMIWHSIVDFLQSIPLYRIL